MRACCIYGCARPSQPGSEMCVEHARSVQIAVDKAESDPVHRPAHYTAGKIECIDALESAVAGLEGPAAALTWTAMKYLWRWSKKNGVEDLEKARWYIDRLIAHLRKEK